MEKQEKKTNKEVFYGIMILAVCIFMYSSAMLIKSGLSEIGAGVELGLRGKNAAALEAKDKIMLNLQEAALFLSVSEGELLEMIEIEKMQLKEFGSFNGVMIPYIVVDGQKYFSKDALKEWAKEAGLEFREYDTHKDLVF
jgi:hypothetical protein